MRLSFRIFRSYSSLIFTVLLASSAVSCIKSRRPNVPPPHFLARHRLPPPRPDVQVVYPARNVLQRRHVSDTSEGHTDNIAVDSKKSERKLVPLKGAYFELNTSPDTPSPSFEPIEAVPEDAPVAEAKNAEAQFRDPTVESDPLNTYLQVGSWIAQWDAPYEAWYYYNSDTGVSTWDKPAELEGIDFTDPVPDIEQVKETIKANQVLQTVNEELDYNDIVKEIDGGEETVRKERDKTFDPFGLQTSADLNHDHDHDHSHDHNQNPHNQPLTFGQPTTFNQQNINNQPAFGQQNFNPQPTSFNQQNFNAEPTGFAQQDFNAEPTGFGQQNFNNQPSGFEQQTFGQQSSTGYGAPDAYGAPVAEVVTKAPATYSAPAPAEYGAPAPAEYGAPVKEVTETYGVPKLPSYEKPKKKKKKKSKCGRDGKDWGLFKTKPCGKWKTGINDNIKESAFYSNITKDFLTVIIKVGGWTALNLLFYGGSIFGATALQKSGINSFLPSLTDVMFAKRSFSDSPLDAVKDSAGRYLLSLEQSGSEHLDKILNSILKDSK